ncbi:MAG: (Fe-S)-binding protein [Cyanobacteria bacterium REEB446]|nr:(Fe-S)-binding protein [Cyanobacteria bacterium REEB446]
MFKENAEIAMRDEELDKIKACIHCGICLSACPTYLTTGNEGNSPRGRLYLIKDLIQGEVPELDATGQEYLDNCLSCMACETVCPSGVEYIQLLDYARHEKQESSYSKGFWGLVRKFSFAFLLDQRYLLNLGRIGLKVLNIFYKLFPFLPKLSKVQPSREISYTKLEVNKLYPSAETILDVPDSERTVLFNLGCVMDTLYNSVHHDTIKVLNAAGYHVYVPASGCCGALASHSGEFKIGEKQTEKFIQAQCDALNKLYETEQALGDFSNPIVFNSAGCGAHVKDKVYLESLVVKDIAELIDPDNWLAPVSLEAFKAKLVSLKGIDENAEIEDCAQSIKAVYHPACHLYHAQGLTTQYQSLLALIPNLELIPFLEAEVCCGSAGFYNLIKSQLAEPIGERKAANIKKAGVDLVITANPGCMSQIEAHLSGGQDNENAEIGVQKQSHKVIHPMSLLAQCLRT